MKMKTSPNDVSNKELLQEFRKLSDKMDIGFEALKKSDHEILEAVQELSSDTDARFNAVDARFSLLEHRVTRVEARMVTKDYLDDKLADLKSDFHKDTAKQIERALK